MNRNKLNLFYLNLDEVLLIIKNINYIKYKYNYFNIISANRTIKSINTNRLFFFKNNNKNIVNYKNPGYFLVPKTVCKIKKNTNF